MFIRLHFLTDWPLQNIRMRAEFLFAIFASVSIHIIFLFAFMYQQNTPATSVEPLWINVDFGNDKNPFYKATIVLPVAPGLTHSLSKRTTINADAMPSISIDSTAVVESHVRDDLVHTELQAVLTVEHSQPDPTVISIQNNELGDFSEFNNPTQNWQPQSKGGVFARAMSRRQHAASSLLSSTNIHESQDSAFKSVQFLETLTNPYEQSAEQKLCQLNSNGAWCEFPWVLPADLASQWSYWALRGLAPGHLLINTSNLLLGNKSP